MGILNYPKSIRGPRIRKASKHEWPWTVKPKVHTIPLESEYHNLRDLNLVERPSNTEVAVGLSGPSNSSDNRKAILQLINRLRDIGCAQTDTYLPIIAVVGNGNVGKSSLIESISGITLPSSYETCTRCPTECKLLYSDSPWKCLIKLHFITDANGVPTASRVVAFGDPITSKPLVKDRIQRAQRAILNPAGDPETYLLQNEFSDVNEISFSKNYISLEISSSELTDLSFVDLPGLTASIRRGDTDGSTDLILSTITSYIEKPSCIILLTVSCENDFEKQEVHHLVRQYDPEGRRTVGVLTKPDRIPPGREHIWLKILRNETEPLGNNWYCVKQPTSSDVTKGVTWTKARQEEKDWFSSMQPWASLGQQYQRFLGTNYLTERLSLILLELAIKRLLEVQTELSNAIQETENKLCCLPKAPSESLISEMIQIVIGFSQDVERRIWGIPVEDGLLRTIRSQQEFFRRAIQETSPDFFPLEMTMDAEVSEDLLISGKCGGIMSVEKSQNIHVEDVLNALISGNHPSVVHHECIRQITKKWREPAMDLLGRVYAALRAELVKLVQTHFEHLGDRMTAQVILMIVNDHLHDATERTKERLQWLIDLEQNLMLPDSHSYTEYKNKFLAYFKAYRDNIESVTESRPDRYHHEASIDNTDFKHNQPGFSVSTAEPPELLPPTEALHVMASVQAHFQVAYKRFTEMVPLVIDHEIVVSVRNGIDKAILEGLGITGPDGYNRCKSLMEGRLSVTNARQDMQEKLKVLQAAREELKQLVLKVLSNK